MKLRLISEVTVADPDMVFNMLGTAADDLFGGKDKLPDRIRQYKQEQVEYGKSSRSNIKCEKCKHFDERERTCEKVEGKIHPEAVCKLWKKKSLIPEPAAEPDPADSAATP